MTLQKLEALADERAVMVCPQCEGEGSYADGLDDAACSTECTRCGSNGWIVDLAALRVAGEGWQDISTAPRDGTVISLTSTSPRWKYPFPAKWDAATNWWAFADYPLNDIWCVSDEVTHWRPLPAPPKEAE